MSMFLLPRFLLKSALTVAGASLIANYSPKIYADILKTRTEPISNSAHFETLRTQIEPNFSLVGLGIRQVTLLYFNAYSIAFYLAPETIKKLQSSPKWTKDYKSDFFASKTPQKEWYLKDLVERTPDMMAIEIKPVRPTDGGHLRNGFLKFLNQRYKDNLPTLSEDRKEAYNEALMKFRSIFPSAKIAVGKSVLFVKKNERLYVYLDQQELGVVENKDLSAWFFEAYLDGTYITPSFVKDVALGLEKLIN